jgi:hypothetical protein
VKFQILTDGKVRATVDAASHPQAAATYWRISLDGVRRYSGWGGADGMFAGGPMEIYVRRLLSAVPK